MLVDAYAIAADAILIFFVDFSLILRHIFAAFRMPLQRRFMPLRALAAVLLYAADVDADALRHA